MRLLILTALILMSTFSKTQNAIAQFRESRVSTPFGKCESAPANIFEENLQNISSDRIPFLDGRFLSLAVRQEPGRIQKNQFRNLNRSLKNQVAMSLTGKANSGARFDNAVESQFSNLDQNLVYTFQWSHARGPHDWYQVVYYYNEDRVSAFLFIMNTTTVAARIVDGDMMICDDIYRVK